MVKIILLKSALILSAPAAAKTQYLRFNSPFQLINHISSDLQKLVRYFNGTALQQLLDFLEFHRHYSVRIEELTKIVHNF